MDKRRMPGFSAEEFVVFDAGALRNFAVDAPSRNGKRRNPTCSTQLVRAIDPWVDQSVVATLPPEASTLRAAATSLGATKKVVKIGSNLWT